MKKLKWISPFLLFSAIHAYAQHDAGNGGIAYVCRDPLTNQITKARLLDLWEPIGFTTLRDDSSSEQEQLENGLKKIDRLSAQIGKNVRDTQTMLQGLIMHSSKPLPLTNDALPDYTPEKNCAFEQVARYGYVNEVKADRLRIYDEIYNSVFFSNSDRAALMLHEAIYYWDKTNDFAWNSLRTRRIVSSFFSSSTPSMQAQRDLADVIFGNRWMLRYVPYILTNRDEPAQLSSFSQGGHFSFPHPVANHCTLSVSQNGLELFSHEYSFGGWHRFLNEMKGASDTFLNQLKLLPGSIQLKASCRPKRDGVIVSDGYSTFEVNTIKTLNVMVVHYLEE